MYAVTAQVDDILGNLMAASNPLLYIPELDAPATSDLGTGRYLRVSPGTPVFRMHY